MVSLTALGLFISLNFIYSQRCNLEASPGYPRLFSMILLEFEDCVDCTFPAKLSRYGSTFALKPITDLKIFTSAGAFFASLEEARTALNVNLMQVPFFVEVLFYAHLVKSSATCCALTTFRMLMVINLRLSSHLIVCYPSMYDTQFIFLVTGGAHARPSIRYISINRICSRGFSMLSRT